MNKTFNSESGRSMVEMLGVLAVIGVLSVGGIYGYTIAMKKHKANELLNEAGKRAVVVAAQIAAGKSGSALSIAEFTENEFYGATFSGVTDNNNGTFSLNLTLDSGFDTKICDQMKATAGTDAKNPSIPDGCATITYNNDLSNGVSTGPETISDPIESCPAGTSKWSGGETVGELSDGTACQCPNGKVWTGTACDSPEQTKECSSFEGKECGAGYYCRFKGQSGLNCYADSSNRPLDDEDGSPVSGVCTKVTGAKKSKSGKFYVSSVYMDWFSAQSWCQSFGKNLVSYTTIHNSPYNCDKSSSSSCDFDYFRETEGLTQYYWTKELSGSCHAWHVLVRRDYFYNYGRGSGDYFALCE